MLIEGEGIDSIGGSLVSSFCFGIPLTRGILKGKTVN